MSYEFRIDFGRGERGLPYGHMDGWSGETLEAEFNERRLNSLKYILKCLIAGLLNLNSIITMDRSF